MGNMTSKERVIRALNFDFPDKIPIEMWVLPAGWAKHGQELADEYQKSEPDILGLPFGDPTSDARLYEIGVYRDEWGSVWHNCQYGIVGEVKEFPIDDWSKLDSYRPPVHLLDGAPYHDNCVNFAKEHPDKFVRGGWVKLFEQMQFLRGVVDLYMDIAMDLDEVYKLRDIVMEYNRKYLKTILQYDFDAVTFGDDWGSQQSLLISPDSWRKIFKPAYQEMFDMVKAAGKHVFFHSDGYILDLYEEFISMGVSALNSQIGCMGIDAVAKYKGRITFWGEISRQTTLPFGTPEDVINVCREMREKLTVNGGGLIGQSEIDMMTPMENIKAFFAGWNS